MSGKLKDLTGNRYGRLTVLGLDRVENKKSFWRCLCDCGNHTIVRSDCLKSGTGRPCTLSCGCYNREKKSSYIDDRSKEKLYRVYYGILERCNNPNATAYKHYGARGIKCLFGGYPQFKSWALSNGYKEGLTIDRIDNNGNYEPSNCRWVTQAVQNTNKRPRNMDVLITVNGKTKNLRQIAKESGIKYGTLYYRYKRGLPLFSPVK